MNEKKLFGEICVELGYLTHADVEKALAIQRQLARDGKPHKLIGIIMHESGMLDNDHLIKALKAMDSRAKLAGK